MDLALFSEENFDPKTWINDVFKGQNKMDAAAMQQHASSLVMRLQLAIQEVNTSLEDTSQQVLSGLPRVVRDVESLGQEASLVKTQMAALMTDLKKVSCSGNNSSLDKLVRLDCLKSRLTQSAQALRQADNWTTLATEVEEVLEAGELEVAANKVVQLHRCLSVLAQTPDSEDRAALLNSFQLRIEAMASPHVVEAFTHHNLSSSIKYSSILRSVGRGLQVQSYYHQVQLTGLEAEWGALLEADPMTGPQPVCLAQYYDHLATLLHKQVSWVSEVFPDCEPRLLLCLLAIAAVTDLQPSITQVVSSAAKLQEEPLQLLCVLRAAMDNFLKQTKHTFEGRDGGSEALKEAGVVLSRAVYTPLANQLHYYQQYEQATLLAHLNSAAVMRTDVPETLLQLREYGAKMRAQCDLAANRCLQVSGLTGCEGLVAGVAGYVTGVVAVLAQARKAVAGLHKDITQDWTVFTTCLDLITTAGVVLMAVEECEESVSSTVASAQLCWDSPPPPYTLSPGLLLTPDRTNKLRDYITTIRDSNTGSLQKSVTEVQKECNACVSAALHTIISPIEAHLSPLPQLPVWGTHQPSSTLSSALSPQEYVTQMGQYLLTLPQHLEPLLMTPSPALNRALQQVTILDDVQHPGLRAVSESEVSAADFLICRVAYTTCQLYTEAVLHIPALVQHAQPQLITDIEYVCNILEDLGVGSCSPLDQLLQLLGATPSEYAGVSESLQGASLRMVAAVRQMRDISAST
uniref:Conserved oligomeric Golgi complex subunit 7 n=2 Tax=Hirondellea gigas TaxID=1518452 RepID=A0A2P2I5Q8_9CRUS